MMNVCERQKKNKNRIDFGCRNIIQNMFFVCVYVCMCEKNVLLLFDVAGFIFFSHHISFHMKFNWLEIDIMYKYKYICKAY